MTKREIEDIKKIQMEPLEMKNIISELQNTLIAVETKMLKQKEQRQEQINYSPRGGEKFFF